MKIFRNRTFVWLIFAFLFIENVGQAEVITSRSITAATSVSSAAFPLSAPTPGALCGSVVPPYGFSVGFGYSAQGTLLVGCTSSLARFLVDGTAFQLNGNIPLLFSTLDNTTPGDAGFDRLAAGVMRPRGASGANGWLQQAAGRVRLSSNYTNATTTFSNTALSIAVTTGRRYSFEAAIFASESVAVDGAKLDFAGGSATSTNFVATCVLVNALGTNLPQVNATSAALATVMNIAALTDTAVHHYKCAGTFEPSSTGTFIIRAAKNSNTTGTLTLLRGSHLWMEDTP